MFTQKEPFFSWERVSQEAHRKAVAQKRLQEILHVQCRKWRNSVILSHQRREYKLNYPTFCKEHVTENPFWCSRCYYLYHFQYTKCFVLFVMFLQCKAQLFPSWYKCTTETEGGWQTATWPPVSGVRGVYSCSLLFPQGALPASSSCKQVSIMLTQRAVYDGTITVCNWWCVWSLPHSLQVPPLNSCFTLYTEILSEETRL